MDFPKVQVSSRQELRQWLASNHKQRESIWLVTWKREHPGYFPYSDVVDEALCFGWIDSLPRKLDETKTMHLLSPRKPKSAWSAVNKAKVEQLIAFCMIEAAGLAAIELAKSNGAWDKLNSVETLALPCDLEAAFEASAEVAFRNWNSFSRLSRRGILEWISLAKRSETRRSRIDQTVTLAGQGIKANHPKGRNR